MRRTSAITFAVLATAASLASCGAQEVAVEDPAVTATPASTPDGVPPQVLTAAAIRSTQDGTPERALFQWWQAGQFGDADAVVDLTAPQILESFDESRLRRLVRVGRNSFAGLRHFGTTLDGETARVRIGVVRYRGSRPDPGAGSLYTVVMRRTGDAWGFGDSLYLNDLARAYGVER